MKTVAMLLQLFFKDLKEQTLNIHILYIYFNSYIVVYGLGVEISTVSKFPNRRGGVTPGTLYFIWLVILSHTWINMVKGWGSRLFPSSKTGGGGVTLGTSPIFHLISYIVPYMNVYGWRVTWVGILSVLKLPNRRG